MKVDRKSYRAGWRDGAEDALALVEGIVENIKNDYPPTDGLVEIIDRLNGLVKTFAQSREKENDKND